MENNSDRMGFALIALSVVAFVLLAVNGTLQPTVKGFFNGFKDWQTQTFDGINESNKQDVTHTAYANNAEGTDGFTTTKPNLNLVLGTKDFSGNWTNSAGGWENDGTYKGLTVKKKTWQWHGIFKPFTAQKDGIYTFSAYIKGSGNNANIRRYVEVWDIKGIPKWIDANNAFVGDNFDWKRDSFTVNLKTGDTLHPRYELAGSGDSILWTAGHKWEEGSIATPYMQNASEAKPSDEPKYIGTYTDKSDSASQDPKKYTWKSNPEYHE